ncbi:DUF6993 domain-containing protein [Pseudoclavibacter helvolus]|uniref:DUF6993 domain-containing protein n=1 Tax=Pseudoclavibacter helvolus TaxID=255205 RepID=A0A7W4YFP7_9MICO|nr:hypothetical protein [Pseudoclavibacter helvolus]MBB2957813.1 hypothetical protein [Pseudoclavibacter helvolus]
MRCSRLIAPAALVAVLALAGCSSQEGQPPAETTAAAEPTQAAPAIFVPGGSAGENKPIFDQTNLQTIATNGSASSVELVNALSTTGFDKAAMEVTFDRTNVDLEADYIIVSVKIGEECLVGQRGPRGYTSDVVAPVSTGKCLIGLTQPITW